jgi:carbonic anhydrase
LGVDPDEIDVVPPDEALARLVAGNERFQRGEQRWSRMTPEMLASFAAGQRPFATILGCSDSRVPPEIIFDAGVGDLFVVRVAGNVLSTEVAGSIQYAGAHLQTKLFVVLGHEGCGAVHAAIQTVLHGARHKSRIHLLVESIIPAVGEIDPALAPAVQLSLAVERNVRWSVRQIAESPEGRARLADSDIKLVGAVYEIRSGRVRILDDES